MRRNWDTIRAVLLAVETDKSVKNDDQTVGHLRMAIDGRLLDVDMQLSAFTQSSAEITESFCLTWEGYELLDTIRDERVWADCQLAIAMNGGGLPTDLLIDVARLSIQSHPVIAGSPPWIQSASNA